MTKWIKRTLWEKRAAYYYNEVFADFGWMMMKLTFVIAVFLHIYHASTHTINIMLIILFSLSAAWFLVNWVKFILTGTAHGSYMPEDTEN